MSFPRMRESRKPEQKYISEQIQKGRRKMTENRQQKKDNRRQEPPARAGISLRSACQDCEFSTPAVGAAELVLTCDHKKPSNRLIVKADECCDKFIMARELVPPHLAAALAAGAKLIPLTQGRFAIVDADDYDQLSQYKWYAIKTPKTYYAARSSKRKNIRMHRLITSAPKGLFVDHIKHNGLDNRKTNLRLCTRRQNNRNRRPCNKTSKYKGVCWNKHAKKFMASISIDGKNKTLGYFDDQVDAAKAYDKAAKKLFGEFAYLNFPKEI